MRDERLNVAVIGCGGKARGHVRDLLKQPETNTIVVVSDPAPAAYEEMREVFASHDFAPPPNEPDLQTLLETYGDELDAAIIVTPHAFHADQAIRCLEAGLDVLLEKPMVVTADEARALIETQRRTGGVLVVAFNGSLSPQVREAARLLRSDELGRILSVSATVWEGWASRYAGHWKQNPVLSGGGFMFDTGAHMLNTVTDLVGEEFLEVAAWLENNDSPVDVVGVVIGRLGSGALVTMNACGAAIPSIGSTVDLYCTKGTLRTGIWGERLELQRESETALAPVGVPTSIRVWDQFLAVRRGDLPNPSPAEVGLRMAKLWDAIRLSAEHGGARVRVGDGTLARESLSPNG